MSVIAGSHIVIATEKVSDCEAFFSSLFELTPYFSNAEFCEFVLPSRFRIAFFKPTGKAGKYFEDQSNRSAVGLGLTVKDVDTLYRRLENLKERFKFETSGPPKEHPWGEKSFLLLDPIGTRWEITQTPSKDGMLVNRENS